jgi:D-glycero-D-manno-heptose 1,7-bisphosphate phosphatase
MTSELVRQACILVGGKGTRLGDLTHTIPKPLIAIGDNTAFLDVVIEQIARQGFDDIVLLAGYLGHLVYTRYEGRTFGSARIRVVIEPEPLGTGGALVAAREIIAPQFMLINGDTFFDINLRALSVGTCAADHEALLALRHVPDASRYGSVVLDGDRVVRFLEKRQADGPALISAGTYVLRASIMDRIRSLPCSIETDIFPALAEERRLRGQVCEGYFIDIGLPETLQQARRDLGALRHRPAAFLDRDGVINADHGYVHRPDQVDWIPGAQNSVRRLNDLGYRVIVVTNQAGVAHGHYGEDSVHALHAWMQDELAAKGAFIDAFYYCPYHPEARVKRFRQQHIDRKPQPGMILRAFADLHIDRERSFLVGDKQCDIEAARRAGIRGLLFPGGNLADFLEKCVNGFGPCLQDSAVVECH